MWDKATLRQIMTACVIMHNMIVEDERSEDEDEDVHYEGVGQLVRPTPPEVRNRTREFREFLQAHHNITKQANPHPTSARSYRAPLAASLGHVSVLNLHIHVVLYHLFLPVEYLLFYQSCTLQSCISQINIYFFPGKQKILFYHLYLASQAQIYTHILNPNCTLHFKVVHKSKFTTFL